MKASERVLQLVSQIPKGRVITYGQLAKWSGIASARCMGQILHRNPHPIAVPCHRVVAKDGSLHGYAGGLDKKRHLLESEGISIEKDCIDLTSFGWTPPESASKK